MNPPILQECFETGQQEIQQETHFSLSKMYSALAMLESDGKKKIQLKLLSTGTPRIHLLKSPTPLCTLPAQP